MNKLQLGARQCWYGYLEKGCLVQAEQGSCRLRNLSAETDGMAYFARIGPDQPHLVFRAGWMMLEVNGEQRCELRIGHPLPVWHWAVIRRRSCEWLQNHWLRWRLRRLRS